MPTATLIEESILPGSRRLNPISSANIRESIKAGRIIEAGTLLTMDGGSLPEEERREFEQELARLQAEAIALVARAEALETEGRSEEAKACYESILLFAADFPGIQDHIKQMEESLALTKAVQRRSRRIREAAPVKRQAPRPKKSFSLLGVFLAASIVVVLLFLLLAKNQPVPSPEKARPDERERHASAPPASLPATPVASIPIQTAETPAIPEPVNLPEEKKEESPPPVPVQSEVAAGKAAELLPEDNKKQLSALSYRVQPGDSLSKIAQRQFCNQDAWKQIYQRNKELIANPEILLPGMELRLNDIESRCPPAP